MKTLFIWNLAVIVLLSVVLSSCDQVSSILESSSNEPESSSFGSVSSTTTFQLKKPISFPYLALLRITYPFFPFFDWWYLPGIFDCGGSIISDRWVLTAAHCLEDVKFVVVVVGDGIRLDRVYPGNIYLHPKHEFFHRANDIALINTPKIHFSSSVRAIRLPQRNPDPAAYVSETAVVPGWKITTRHSGRFLKDVRSLLHTELTIEECPAVYRNSSHASICTLGGNNTSECFSNPGVPLYGFDEQGPILYGIASVIHFDKCIPHRLTGYARVEKYLDWIQNTTSLV